MAVTLTKNLFFEGTGLHSGRPVRLTLSPWRVAGFWVKVEGEVFPIGLEAAVETPLNTALVSPSGQRLGTVEHVLAALSGLDMTGVLIEVVGGETPAFDGSAGALCAALAAASRPWAGPVESWTVVKPVEVADGARLARLTPAPARRLDVTVDFAHPAVGRQRWEGPVTPDVFAAALAGARTFGFIDDIARLRAAGLGLGANLSSAVAFDNNGVVNPEGLRWPDECVRHKALDLIGDLALAGAPVVGLCTAVRPGHDLTRRLLRAAFAEGALVRTGEMRHAA